MKIKSRVFVLLGCLLLLSSCTASSVALVDAIVSSAEILLPLIPGLAPADSAAVGAYIDGALKITNDLLANGVTTDGVAIAVQDFGNLVVPQLSAGASQQTRNLLNGVVSAISNFLKAYAGAPPTATVGHETQAKAIPPLSDADQVKVEALKVRVRAAQLKTRR